MYIMMCPGENATLMFINWKPLCFNRLATWLNVWDWRGTKRCSQRCTTQREVSKLHLRFDTTRWRYCVQNLTVVIHKTSLNWDMIKCLLCSSRDENRLKEVWASQRGRSECLQAEVGEDSCWICHLKQVRRSLGEVICSFLYLESFNNQSV